MQYVYGDRPDNDLPKHTTRIRRKVSAEPDAFDEMDIESDAWGNLVEIIEYIEADPEIDPGHHLAPSGLFTRPLNGILDLEPVLYRPCVVTTIAYDGMSRVASVTRHRDAHILYAFDPLNRLIETTDFRGGVTRTSYDDALKYRQIECREGQGQPQQLSVLARTKTVSDPMGQRRVLYYDALGRLIFIQREVETDYGQGTADAIWRYQWDGRSRLQSLTDPYGVKSQWIYDGLDRLREKSVTDGLQIL